MTRNAEPTGVRAGASSCATTFSAAPARGPARGVGSRNYLDSVGAQPISAHMGAQDQPARLAARTADATSKEVRHSSGLDFHLAPAAPGRRVDSRAAPSPETD